MRDQGSDSQDNQQKQLLALSRELLSSSQTFGLSFFHVLPEARCPYLTDHFERKVVTELTPYQGTGYATLLNQAGFRRSTHYAYRPACQNCNACKPVRIRVKDFKPSKNMKRTVNRNTELVSSLAPLIATEEHFFLFRRYIDARHGDGDMANMNATDFRRMVEESPIPGSLMELRDSKGELVAACLTDWFTDGGSAIYSYFDPDDAKLGLGKMCIYSLIQHCKKRDLEYLYLGYWIPDSPKMAYKARFHPLEVFTSQGWIPLG